MPRVAQFSQRQNFIAQACLKTSTFRLPHTQLDELGEFPIIIRLTREKVLNIFPR
jgi:hypothetical protein